MGFYSSWIWKSMNQYDKGTNEKIQFLDNGENAVWRSFYQGHDGYNKIVKDTEWLLLSLPSLS